MRRRDCLGALLAAPLAGQRVEYRDYSRCLPDYLRRIAREQHAARERALSGDIKARQRWVRDTFWKLTGGQPERTSLNIRATGAFERDRYRVEKLIYESRPGLHISANLYLPKIGSPPYPGVLFQAGHSLNGKAATPYQYGCQALAQLGFVVLAFDPMGQGERTYYPKDGGTLTRLGSADDEHTVPGRQMLLVGDTATRFQTWDAVRGLDVLASHPLVDPKRLASTGNSGGGTLTMFLAAVDDRLVCAAPSCPNTENIITGTFDPPGAADDAEQNLVGGGPVGFDRWDTLWPFAPKPLLILVSAKDAFGTYSSQYIENGRAEFAKLQKAYVDLGAPDQIGWVETPLPHGFTYNMRLEVENWFRLWLQGEKTPLTKEPPVRAEADEALWASPSGNVVRSYGGKTPLRMVGEAAAAIRTPEKPAGLRELLGIDMLPQPEFRSIGTADSRHARIEAVEVLTTPEVSVPAWLFHPKAKPSKNCLLILESSRSRRWSEDDLYQTLASRGVSVCAADLRGLGDMAPEYPRHAPGHARYLQDEDKYAWSSLVMGKPLVGQRAADILALVNALSARGMTISLAARNELTIPALFAAALDTRITRIYLAGGLASYRHWIDAEEYRQPTANLVFDILRHTDVPQLVASLAPRPVTIAGPTDATGRPIEPRTEAAWDVDTLLGLT